MQVFLLKVSDLPPCFLNLGPDVLQLIVDLGLLLLNDHLVLSTLRLQSLYLLLSQSLGLHCIVDVLQGNVGFSLLLGE